MVCFMQYLTNLECPLDPSAASAKNDVLDWLLHYAVDLEYGDRGAHSGLHPNDLSNQELLLVTAAHCISRMQRLTVQEWSCKQSYTSAAEQIDKQISSRSTTQPLPPQPNDLDLEGGKCPSSACPFCPVAHLQHACEIGSAEQKHIASIIEVRELLNQALLLGLQWACRSCRPA